MTPPWRIAALVLGGAAAGLAPGGAPAAAPEIVARVNGEPVIRAELERMRSNPLTLRQLQQELGVQEPDAEALDRLATRKLIHRRLMIQEARRRKIAISDQELDKAIAALRRRFGDLRSFGEWMHEQGLDETTLFEAIRGDMAAERAWEAVLAEVRATDGAVQRYYEAHKRELRREEVRLQIIAVDDAAAAEEIMAALRRGEDFGRLARQRSIGVRAAMGGDTGWIATETLQPPLLQAVATLKPGLARGPLQRGTELLIVRLDGWRIATRSLAEARPEIERRLLLPAGRREAAEAWLREREAASRIEVFPRVAARRD